MLPEGRGPNGRAQMYCIVDDSVKRAPTLSPESPCNNILCSPWISLSLEYIHHLRPAPEPVLDDICNSLSIDGDSLPLESLRISDFR